MVLFEIHFGARRGRVSVEKGGDGWEGGGEGREDNPEVICVGRGGDYSRDGGEVGDEEVISYNVEVRGQRTSLFDSRYGEKGGGFSSRDVEVGSGWTENRGDKVDKVWRVVESL